MPDPKKKEEKKTRDTPLAETPEPTKVTDVGTALADIAKRSAERKNLNDISNEKLQNAKDARSRVRRERASTPKLVGLKGFGDYGSKM